MELVAGSLLVYFTCICYVQCQWNQIAKPEDNLINPKSLRTLNQVQSRYEDIRSAQCHPTPVPDSGAPPHTGLRWPRSTGDLTRNGRSRLLQDVLGRIGVLAEPLIWNHHFSIEANQPGSLTKETANIWQKNTKRLKHTLERDTVFEFLNPTGLRIAIPDENSLKIIEFHVKLNEQFLENDVGFTPTAYKRDDMWSFYIPQLRVQRGDVLYYRMRVKRSKGNFDAIVRGLLEINRVGSNPPVDQGPPRKPALEAPLGGGNPGNLRPLMLPTSCTASVTNRNGVATPVCRGEVLLDKRFYNMDGWKHQVTIGGNYPEDEFMVFTKDSSNSWLNNGILLIKPSLLEDKYDDSFVRSGQMLLDGCTSYIEEQCIRQAHHYLILPPIISARITTKDKFSFRYGTVELKVKLPCGNWIVPELWLEAVGPSTERVVMGLSRGNTDDSEYGWRTLEVGVVGESQSSLWKRTQDTPWSQNFHTFKLEWNPEGIKFMVDGQELHRTPAENYPILSKEVYISLGVHVAGNRDFPDNIEKKPWKNSDPKRFARFWDDKKNWFRTWNEDSSLQVEYIKVTALS